MQPKAKKAPTKAKAARTFYAAAQRETDEISELCSKDKENGHTNTAWYNRPLVRSALGAKYTSPRLEPKRAGQRLTTYSRLRPPLPVSCRWKEISAEEKATYEKMATEDKARYGHELAAFEAEHGVPEARPKT